MEHGTIKLFYGNGEGKSAAALGKALMFAVEGQKVIIIQFFKRNFSNIEFFSRLEPDIKLFRFEKSSVAFEELSEEEKHEECQNIKNGLNFAKKVLVTGECDLLILDEVSALVDEGIITMEEFETVINAKSDETSVILTGITFPAGMEKKIDSIIKIECEK